MIRLGKIQLASHPALAHLQPLFLTVNISATFLETCLKKIVQQLELNLFALGNHESFMFASLNEIILCCIEHSEPVLLALFLKHFYHPEFKSLNCIILITFSNFSCVVEIDSCCKTTRQCCWGSAGATATKIFHILKLQSRCTLQNLLKCSEYCY